MNLLKLFLAIVKWPLSLWPKKRKSRITFILLIIFGIFIIFVLNFYYNLPDISYLKNKNPGTTALMEQRIAEAEASGKKYRIRQKWVAFKKIPKLLRQAVRISEDASFYLHNGLDFTEIQESLIRNFKEGKITRGVITINFLCFFKIGNCLVILISFKSNCS